MVLRIAIPITAPTVEEARRDIDRAAAYKDGPNVQHVLELRMDYMRHPRLSDVEELLAYSEIPKIVTVRAADEGGNFEGSEEERIALLQRAIFCGAKYVDIENAHYVSLDRTGPTKLIVSSHNFQITPDDLGRIYNSIASKNPDIVKIATYAQSHDDSLRMLNLILDVTRVGQEIIGICMGPLGMVTREHGPNMGSYLTFASLDEGKASAPGQLTVDELTQNWRNLHYIK